MNDEFLYRLRKDPPPRFAARLKARLDRQEQQSRAAPRFPLLRGFAVAFLIGGSALAATLFAVKGVPPVIFQFFDVEHDAAKAHVAAPQVSPSVVQRGQMPNANVPYAEVGENLESQATSAADQRPDAEDAGASSASSAPSMVTGGPTSGISRLETADAMRGRLIIATSSTTAALTGVLVDEFTRGKGISRPQIAATREVMRKFCPEPVDVTFHRVQPADIAILPRRISMAEFEKCHYSGIRMIEALIGYQAIVVSGAATGNSQRLSTHDLFMALAKEVPDPSYPQRLLDNPYRFWSEVNPAYEARRIQVLGPRDSVRHQAFMGLVLEAGCDTYPWIKSLDTYPRSKSLKTDAKLYESICHSLREDQAYSEEVVTDALITRTLPTEADALAVLDYAQYRRHKSNLSGSLIEGVEPSFETISAGTYPAARPLYIYVKAKADARRFGGAATFLDAALNDFSLGPSGYLTRQGVIPPDAAQRNAIRAEALQFKELNLIGNRR